MTSIKNNMPSDPNNQLLQSYKNHANLLTGKRVWLACSGGRDSMALAFATFQLYLQGKLAFCPQLVHVNHGLQLANDDWAALVSDWAKSMGIPCQIVHADFHGTVHEKLDGTDEQSARNARYDVISSLMNQDDVLMLAHHANDQVETVLMRLFNGAGVSGLSGISEWSTKNIISKKINLWRPWLNITREQITSLANQNNLPYIDDPTNLIGKNVRSWLRTELIPTIKQAYPQVVKSINRSACLLDEANDILTEVYQQDLKSCIIKEVQLAPYDLILNIDKVKDLSIARQRQLIHRWLQGDEPTPASKHRVDEIFQLIHRNDNDQQAELHWQGVNNQYTVRRHRQQLHRLRWDWLAFLQSDESRKAFYNNEIQQSSQEASKQYLQKYWLHKQEEIKTGFLNKNLTTRPLRKIDKFAPNPKQQNQSGKKLMQLLSIPTWERKAVYVLEYKERVAKGNGVEKIVAVFTLKEAFLVDFSELFKAESKQPFINN